MSNRLHQIKAYATKRNLPLIAIKADDISILNEPCLFYKYIIDRVKTINTRLTLSSLYLGTGPKEDYLVQAIQERIKQKRRLKVNLVLDANRATRPDGRGKSSLSTLGVLLNSDNLKLHLVKTYISNFGISNLLQHVQRLNEILSTYHSKLLVFDDDLLITGANLSGAYFESRQDRYMVIKDSRLLSDYVYEILEKVNQSPESIKSKIEDHNAKYINQSTEDSDTFVIPLNQHGPSGLNDIEDFLKFLNSTLPNDSRIYVSTGYFNPSSTINQMQICSVLAPSETANGFFGGNGLLKYIPRIYSAIQKMYIQSHSQCKLFLYEKPNWSFHAKGLWVEGLEDLHIHLIGSSNFNCRSSSRDFETQIALLTSNKNLADKLRDERLRLWEEARPANLQDNSSIYGILARMFRKFL